MWAVLLGALLVAMSCTWPAGVAGCSSAVIANSSTDGYASFRTMDFPRLPLNQLAWVPAGSELQLVPVTGRKTWSTLGSSYKAKYSYVGVAAARGVVGKLYEASLLLPFPRASWPGNINEGLNSAGLGVSLQWNRNNTKVNGYLGSGPSIDQVDLPAYLLASYKSVAEVKAAIDGGLTATWNSALNIGSIIINGFPYIPCHLHVIDDTGASLVLEWAATGEVKALDNPLGVLTNGPNLQQQYEHYQWWTNLVSQPPYLEVPTVHGGKFIELIGSYNQSDRFTRLAVLRQLGGAIPWASPLYGLDDLTPAYIPKGAPPTNPALITAIDLSYAVYLPRGIDDSSASGPGSDWTIWTTLRDHKLRTLYYRVANSPQWRSIDLGRVAWASLNGKIRYTPLQSAGAWAVDDTRAFRKPLGFGNEKPANETPGVYPLDK